MLICYSCSICYRPAQAIFGEPDLWDLDLWDLDPPRGELRARAFWQDEKGPRPFGRSAGLKSFALKQIFEAGLGIDVGDWRRSGSL